MFSSFPGKQALRRICVQVVCWGNTHKGLYKPRMGKGEGELGWSCSIGLSRSHGVFLNWYGFSKLSQIEEKGQGLCVTNQSLCAGVHHPLWLRDKALSSQQTSFLAAGEISTSVVSQHPLQQILFFIQKGNLPAFFQLQGFFRALELV